MLTKMMMMMVTKMMMMMMMTMMMMTMMTKMMMMVMVESKQRAKQAKFPTGFDIFSAAITKQQRNSAEQIWTMNTIMFILRS